MKLIKQKHLSLYTGISQPMISQILGEKKRASWASAKKLAALTISDPAIWADGDMLQIYRAIERLERAAAIAALFGISVDTLLASIIKRTAIPPKEFARFIAATNTTPEQWQYPGPALEAALNELIA